MKFEDIGAVSVLDNNNTPACQQDTLPRQHEPSITARAEVLALFNRYDPNDSAVVEGFIEQLRGITDPCSPEGLAALHQHLPLLEALFLHLAERAHTAKLSTDKTRLALAALQAHQAVLRTTALLRAMGAPGSAVVLDRP